MKTYRFHIQPLAPWGSPWRSYTLFGLICWGLEALEGSAALEEALRDFLAIEPPSKEPLLKEPLLKEPPVKEPPFLVSDAFPKGWFPMPVGLRQAVEAEGKKQKHAFLSEKEFRLYLNGKLTGYTQGLPLEDAVKATSRVQASISRETGQVQEGLLFEIRQEVFVSSHSEFQLFVRCDKDWLERIGAVLQFAGGLGMGKKRSTGMGAFQVVGVEHVEWMDVDVKGSEEGFVSLSHFLPAHGDPVEGKWLTHVSYPKFQGDRVKEFLKGRFLYLSPGSVFWTNGKMRPWYGRVQKLEREEFEFAMQYGLCLGAPIRRVVF